jgi:glc operon protein GlcG
MLTKPVMTCDDAAKILLAARAEASSHQWEVSIAVCDDGGHLLGFMRMPGANIASTTISQSKAQTAALMRRETKGVEEMINGGRTAFLSAPGLSGMLEGGVPILIDGQCVGAVGVSGVKPAEDAQVARLGAQALSST